MRPRLDRNRPVGRAPNFDARARPSAQITARPGAICVREAAATSVRRGHPWIFRDRIVAGLDGCVPGDERVVVDEQGASIARAIVDPTSPIGARIWSLDAARPIEASLIGARIERAVALRDRMFGAAGVTTALRWVHGEGDRAPGVVVDRYEDVAVVRLDGAAIERWTDAIVDAVARAGEPRGVRTVGVRSTTRGDDGSRLQVMRGPVPPDEIVVREHGVPFVVSLARGQKTGAFLDQRDNRRRVGALANGRRVLNLFSYAGGFSVHAALGGATSCTSVDVAAAAHVTAQASFKVAGVALDPHTFVTADVFNFLERARDRGDRWDLVVSDPPNMAPSEAARPRALAAYRRLHRLCVEVLAPDGIFCAASCSSHVSLDDFLASLDDEALGRDDLRVVEVAGAGADHPTRAGFSEGRYLKFCVLS